MARGKALSDDLRGAILNMARLWDIDNIVEFTGCRRRTVERILADYRRKGTVAREHLAADLRGLKRSLTVQDVRFLRGTIQHSPDRYLDELQELLEDRCGVEVSQSTIWRALRRSGFTIKKASINNILDPTAFDGITVDPCSFRAQ
ncbi:hypothetical protein BV22DRAFT_1196045 [Leucogyrophana mollusca]|uniref:Uncharacterized protein n=1 Tax=Leucogyrophana mollusca TaxID=85980 RepID=A0ACB8BF61_9AGAM|nr:hypothetical protein BV22DRAFT_1196045 [Leucogyrophana mollusca]